MKGIVRRKRTLLPSWRVLDRSRDIRGCTAWTNDQDKVVIQWSLDEPNSSFPCHQVQPEHHQSDLPYTLP